MALHPMEESALLEQGMDYDEIERYERKHYPEHFRHNKKDDDDDDERD